MSAAWQALSAEQLQRLKYLADAISFVKSLREDAYLCGGRHGKVWIQDAAGEMLSEVKYMGTSSQRRFDAWKEAAERLGQKQ